jgi:penicillin-binding protein 2
MNDTSYLQEEASEIRNRAAWLAGFVLLVFCFLLARAWHLQVFQGNYYRGMAENNRVRLVEITAPRGFLYDRNGNLLVNNTPSFNLYLVLEDIPDLEDTLGKLSRYTGVSKDELNQRVMAKKNLAPSRPLKIKTDLTLKEAALIEGHFLDLPGVRIEAEVKRNYIHGGLAAHFLGHVGEVSPEQLDQRTYLDISPGSIVGQYGVEKTYDAWIRGKQGQKSIEVDVQGHERRILRVQEPIKGNDLYLTLDLDLQRTAEAALGEGSGAVVALDPWTGDILAMVSHPPFDPNLLSGVLTPAAWEALAEDPRHPMNNRVLQGQYPPGSVFKIVVSTALLETDVIPPSFTVNCSGGLRFGKRLYRDWKKGGHGVVGLHRAIVESCDVFFYEAGRRLGIDTLAEYAKRFGLGRPTGIPLASEKSGLIPTTAWKQTARGEPWYPGETLSAAIGQGYITVTPLQMAMVVSTIATHGYQYQPRILKEMKGPKGSLGESSPVLTGMIELREQTIATLYRALGGVVSEDHGTGRAASTKLVDIGGKTGTAQVVGARPWMTEENMPRQFKDHAWFVALAPLDRPRIVVVALVEHGGHGGTAAAPIARKVIEEFFKRDRPAPYHQL